MSRSFNARFAFACGGLCLVWGCATAQQPDIGGGADTSGGTGASTGGGGAGATGNIGNTSNAGHVGSSGSTGTSGASGVAGSPSGGGSTGSAGTSATAGSHSGGTSAAGASSGGTSNVSGSNSGGSRAGGGAGSAGTGATAGSTGIAGSSNGGGAGGAAAGTVLFSDDFEDGATSKWVASGGTWSIVTDGTKAYAQTAAGTGSTVILSAAGSTTWTDQVVEARVKITAFGGSSTSYFAAIYARFNGTDYYSLCLRSDGKLVIRKDKTSLSNAADASITESTWYTVKFSVVGSTLNGYLNGTLLATATDSSLTSGGIAVSTVNTTAEFDDIQVTAP